MAFVGKITPTRGALIKLRDTLKFIQNGLNILKMKRDRLAAELNILSNELDRREAVESQLMEIYGMLREALTNLGYATVFSEASSISEIKINVVSVPVVGVAVPKIRVEEKPKIDAIQNLSLRVIAEKLQSAIEELLGLAQVEADIERIAHELVMLSRKVNALEKNVVPAYVTQIRYIENLLFDEDLEDFAKVKHLKVVTGKKS